MFRVFEVFRGVSVSIVLQKALYLSGHAFVGVEEFKGVVYST